ncbi:hypothetical protein KR52_04790 [Synechococcus sp. KORDI-52]|uniref:DUF3747 domain-containing protein n=1 Tax=Synechococcus sp. KORDI-52 TaxID=585425 RepID=UPI0004E06CD6|nr:DUF3747 domain-containing protein [Synechococcus sp. KORDI-52]AII48464.1 hypothetical protein KR52_04790 [Synechococcus sp. KORDI-52]
MDVMARFRIVAAVSLALAATSIPAALAQGSLFTAVPVEMSNFILVSAPIGQGQRSQLNIYEQRTTKRPCYAVDAGVPAQVDPLLSTFDFTGVCNRYIDGNGYSLRIGGDDLGTRYRLSVVNTGRDIELLATPTRNPSQPTLLVARAGGSASGFIQLKLEPGWTLKRRAYGKKSLGHLYVYRDHSPASSAPAANAAPASSSTVPAETALIERAPIDTPALDDPTSDNVTTPSY